MELRWIAVLGSARVFVPFEEQVRSQRTGRDDKLRLHAQVLPDPAA